MEEIAALVNLHSIGRDHQACKCTGVHIIFPKTLHLLVHCCQIVGEKYEKCIIFSYLVTLPHLLRAAVFSCCQHAKVAGPKSILINEYTGAKV